MLIFVPDKIPYSRQIIMQKMSISVFFFFFFERSYDEARDESHLQHHLDPLCYFFHWVVYNWELIGSNMNPTVMPGNINNHIL